MNIETHDFLDWADGAQRELAHELEQLRERGNEIQDYQPAIDTARQLVSEKEKLTCEIESLTQQLQEEKRLRAEWEMKVAEMSKLSAGMAKKSSEEDLLKALRTYANRSKRKTADKRTFAKSAILEIANANALLLPEDLAATVDSLDDEQAEPKVVNVAGNYNDIHDNGTVNNKD